MTRGPVSLGALADRFGIAPPELPAAPAPPWPALVLATFGAVLAGAALVIAVAVLFSSLDLEPLEGCLLGGMAALGGGVVLSRIDGSVFVRQFALTGGVAGHALLSAALFFAMEAVVAETIGLAAAVSWVAALASWPLLRDGAYRFLSAGMAMTLTTWAVNDATGFAVPVLAALTVPAALALLLAPPRRMDLRGVALALLLAPLPFLDIVAGHGLRALGAAPYAAGVLWLLAPVMRGHGGRFALGIAGVGALAALLPGAAAALLVLALAWRLGSRALAGVGVAALAAFVVHFYYALEVTLLVKSGLLLAGGAVTLGLWAALRRRAAA